MAITTEGLRAVRAGDVTFDAFARETWGDWDRVTKYALRRWGLAGRLDVEDVRQELLLGAWRSISRFDPARSDERKLAQFVMFGAISSARKRFKKQVEGRCVLVAAADVDALRGLSVPRDVPRESEPWALDLALGGCSGRARKAVAAFATHGCLRQAAEVLYDDPATRLEHEFVSRQHARREVRAHVEEVARNMGRIERRAA